MALCALFCALDAWVLDLVPYASVIGLSLSIVGLCLSVSGGRALRANGYSAGTATTGMVLGIIEVVLTGITFLSCGICDLTAVLPRKCWNSCWEIWALIDFGFRRSLFRE